jgi:hypothetical protein
VSYSSLYTQTQDAQLAARVTAAAQQEARSSEAASDFGRAIVNNQASPTMVLMWPVCINTEAAYESALDNGVPNPGDDPSVITDLAILSSIQSAWPADPWPPPSTGP